MMNLRNISGITIFMNMDIGWKTFDAFLNKLYYIHYVYKKEQCLKF